MKIAYFGYDLFYPCLERLLEDGDIEVLKIFSFPEDEDDKNEKIKALAKKHNIEFTTKKVSADDICKLGANGCELLVCAGYIYKIPINDSLKGINLHPSYLPEGRGVWPTAQAILKGVKKTGLSVHMLEKTFDTGDILLQRQYILKENETLESLNHWILENCGDMVYACVRDFYKFYMGRLEQGGGSYWGMPTKEDRTITKSTDRQKADRILRAFYGSQCFYEDGGKSVVIKKGSVVLKSDGHDKNELLPINGGYVLVKQRGE